MKKQLLLTIALLSAGVLCADDDDLTKKDVAIAADHATTQAHLDVAKASMQKAVKAMPTELAQSDAQAIQKAIDALNAVVAKLQAKADKAAPADKD